MAPKRAVRERLAETPIWLVERISGHTGQWGREGRADEDKATTSESMEARSPTGVRGNLRRHLCSSPRQADEKKLDSSTAEV